MATYFKIAWHHQLPQEPTFLYSEVVNGWEVRKVEEFRDGTMAFASESGQLGSTHLSETVFPTIEEIAHDAQFTPEIITRDEFEVVWKAATRDWLTQEGRS